MPRIGKPTPFKLTPFISEVESARPLTEIDKLKEKLSDHQSDLKNKIQQQDIGYEKAEINIIHQRHSEIVTPLRTAIIAPDNTVLPANHINLGTTKGVIRSQFPTAAAVPSFLDMLAEKRVTVLVVIGEEHILNSPLNPKPYPIYFKNTEYSHNNKESLAEFKGIPLPMDVPIECFKLKLINQQDIARIGNPVGIPVIHINQWTDHTSLPVEQLKELARYVNTANSTKYSIFKDGGSRAVVTPQKALPVIHCSAGVGRTGQLIAAMELINPDSTLSLESIIKTLREQGNPNMVQTKGQMDVLIDLAKMLGKPLWIKDEQPQGAQQVSTSAQYPPRFI